MQQPPEGLRPFAVILSVLVAFAVSHTVVVSAFTLVSEAIRREILPHMETLYSPRHEGSVYIPAINRMLFVGCVFVVLFFRSSTRMEAAYGLAIAVAMLMTTFLLCAYLWVRSVTGYSAVFSNIFILLVLALVSSVLPSGSIALISGILVAGQAFGLGLDVGGVVTAVLVILFILFLRFIPEDSTAAVLMAMGVWFGFGALVPLVCGLRKRLASVFSLASGVVICQLVRTMGATRESLSLLEATAYPDRLKLFMGAMFRPGLVVGCLLVVPTASPQLVKGSVKDHLNGITRAGREFSPTTLGRIKIAHRLKLQNVQILGGFFVCTGLARNRRARRRRSIPQRGVQLRGIFVTAEKRIHVRRVSGKGDSHSKSNNYKQ